MTYLEMCKYVFKEEGFPDWRWTHKKRSRKEELKTARQICMYLGNHYFNGISLRQVAEPFGLDHATAIHAFKVIRNRRDTERLFNEKMEKYIHDLDQLFNDSIILNRVTKEADLAKMLMAKIKEMELIAKVYCVLTEKKMIDL